MKFLYLGGFELPDRNAAAHRVIAIAKTLRLAGHEVEFIGLTKDENEVGTEYIYEGFNYTCIRYPKSTLDWLHQIIEFVPLSMIDQKNPDAIILYNFYALAQKRIINYCHSKRIAVYGDLTEWYEESGFSLKQLVKRANISLRMFKYNFELDGVIAISRYLYDFYKTKVNSIYIPATVDYNNPKFERNRVLDSHKPIRLVYAGSVGQEHDGIQRLIETVRSRSSFRLDIVGIDMSTYCEKQNIPLIKSTNVAFHGRLNHNDTLKFVINADFQVIIRPDNLVTRAGFPTKFVESFACGIPVIANPSSNICDYLIDGVNGFVLNDTLTIEKCLDWVERLNDEQLIKLKLNVLKSADFSFDKYVPQINQLINENPYSHQ